MSAQEKGRMGVWLGRAILVALAAIVASACGGATIGTRTDCPPGQTSLDGTCVSQQIADYVGCIRATGATVASNSAKALSAAAGVAGVTASTSAEVQDKLERSYAKQSDANTLEIIHDCHAKTDERAEARAASDSAMAATAAQGGSGAPGPNEAPASSNVTAFLGTWSCAATVEFGGLNGPSKSVHGTGPWIVVDNHDGTIGIIDPQHDDGQCPQLRWSVSGSRAKWGGPPCYKQDGSVARVMSGDASLAGKGLTANGVVLAESAGNKPLKVSFSLDCTR